VNVVINDQGGLLGAHVADGKALAASGAYIAVKFCAATCLMLLAQVPVNRVCFYPDAWIGTHSAGFYDSGATSENGSMMIWERGRDFIARGRRNCLEGAR
jgi:hypothetical protein